MAKPAVKRHSVLSESGWGWLIPDPLRLDILEGRLTLEEYFALQQQAVESLMNEGQIKEENDGETGSQAT